MLLFKNLIVKLEFSTVFNKVYATDLFQSPLPPEKTSKP